jgi:hypothetical protein
MTIGAQHGNQSLAVDGIIVDDEYRGHYAGGTAARYSESISCSMTSRESMGCIADNGTVRESVAFNPVQFLLFG